MATKKCPKCGEENPAEAVMCWACYTPLAGGAAAAAGGGLVAPRGGAAAVTPAATAAAEEEKKAVDPKIFLVAGLLLVALVIGGFTTGLFGGGGSSSSEDSTLPAVDPQGPGNTTGGGAPPPPPPPQQVTMPSSDNSNSSSSDVKPPPIPYTVVSPPNPRYETGTIGIVATQPNVSAAQAAGLARFAKRQFAPNGRWKNMQVAVFSNRAAAKAFQKYQAKRQNIRLSPGDYQALAGQGVWSSVPSFLESNGSREQIYDPSRNPNNWWAHSR